MGAGKVGRLLAESLENEYNVKLLDKDIDKANSVREKLNNT